MRIDKVLEEFGLEKNKGAVYKAALMVGTGSAEEIAKKANLPRTTAHEVLQGLLKIGLVSFITKGRRRVYSAESPERLRDTLREKERVLEGTLPELLSLLNTDGARPRVRFYEGVMGIKAVFEDTLTVQDKKLLGILSMADLYAVPGKEFMEDYVKRRMAADIFLRVIRSEVKEVEEVWRTGIGESREVRYAPERMIFPMTVYIYDGKAAVMGTEREQFGMIIESPDFCRTLKNLFEVLWLASRPQG